MLDIAHVVDARVLTDNSSTVLDPCVAVYQAVLVAVPNTIPNDSSEIMFLVPSHLRISGVDDNALFLLQVLDRDFLALLEARQLILVDPCCEKNTGHKARRADKITHLMR